MESHFDNKILKNAELLLRATMVVTMLVAGISKFCSHGGFHDYYYAQFTRNNLRIQLPGILYHLQLTAIPFIEIILGSCLIVTKYRRYFIAAFVFYFISLAIGHYILEEWIGVDVMMPYIILAVFCYILPAYEGLFIKMKQKNKL